MKIREIIETLGATLVVGDDKLDLEVTSGSASDLMSDLLRNPKEGAVLLTGLNTIQTIRTAVIAGLSVVVLVRGKTPNPEMIEYSQNHGMPLLTSPLNMYNSCGKLYTKGLGSIS
jgi:serine kinase of HPr protein (carbohydrate metabolism regulator)